jgi:hypothetical protein
MLTCLYLASRLSRARRLADGRLVVVKEIKTTALTPKQKVTLKFMGRLL